MNKNQKPISMIINDTRDSIINILNNSGLHISILEYIIKDIATAVEMQVKKVSEQELAMYNSPKEEQDE